MGVSGDDVGSLERNSWDESRLDHQRSSTMRVGLKYITPVLAAGAAAVAIAAAPAAMAETTPAPPATIATAPAAVAPNIVQTAGHGGGGFQGGGDRGGFQGGGDRGGWHGDRGWHGDNGWGNWFGWRR
jgi:hypothetical protein